MESNENINNGKILERNILFEFFLNFRQSQATVSQSDKFLILILI